MAIKFILTLNLLFCLSGFVNCQKPTKCWLPEKYVNKVLDKDTIDCSKLLIPIEGFEEIEKKIYMLTYKGELSPLQNIKITQGCDSGKIEILGIRGLINLKYISRDSLEKYADWKYYYAKINHDIILEIVQQDKRKIEIKFISQIPDYQFQSIKETKAYLYNYK